MKKEQSQLFSEQPSVFREAAIVRRGRNPAVNHHATEDIYQKFNADGYERECFWSVKLEWQKL